MTKPMLPLSLGCMLFALHAYAEEPCPDAHNNVPLDTRGGCVSDLDAPPTHFDFDALEKKMQDANSPQNASPDTTHQTTPRQTTTTNTAQTRSEPKTCTYSAYAWDTKKKRATNRFEVSKAYADVSDDERDPNDPRCTICREDQIAIDTAEFGLKTGKILICHAYADQVASALKTIAESGDFVIEKLEGYRPGKTRGPIDSQGLRTLWSNHSFGAAIDINAHKNAIYSHCPNPITGSRDDVSTCKRGIGGAYDPKANPKTSITPNGIVYKTMTKFWKWGGEIDGDTKDIMHFSITGY